MRSVLILIILGSALHRVVAQDSLVMQIVTVEGVVTIDGKQAKPGEKVNSAQQELIVGKGSASGVLTEQGLSYKLTEGRYSIRLINDFIYSKKYAVAKSDPVPIDTYSEIRLAFDIEKTPVFVYGDSVLLVMKLNRSSDLVSLSELIFTVRFLTLFDDTLFETSARGGYALLKVPDVIKQDHGVVFEISCNSMSSDRYLLKYPDTHDRDRIIRLLAPYDTTSFPEKAIFTATVFELEGLIYDHVWQLSKLKEWSEKDGPVNHPYYQNQMLKFGLSGL